MGHDDDTIPKGTRAARIELHLGKRLRQARIMADLTRVQLAPMIGVSVPQLQKYEAGVTRISSRMLYELTVILKVPASFFFDGVEETVRTGRWPKPPE